VYVKNDICQGGVSLTLWEGPPLGRSSAKRHLVRKIRTIHEQAESTSVDSVLETYWTYGDLISELRLSGQVGYHNSVLKDLSRETGIALRILQHAVAFRGAYSSTPVGQGLSWSHYRVLQ
jgi:hypothetical protein